jgi:hypothetical protein
MANSKAWLDLTPEQKKVKRKEYNDRYKAKHPERMKEHNKAYKERNKETLRVSQTQLQKKRNQAKKIKAIEYLGGVCFDCKLVYPPRVYDFHHLDPTQKDFTIARIIGRSWDKIIPELDKCVLLCANCHRLRHND